MIKLSVSETAEWSRPALLFFIFRFEYLFSGPKSYRDFRETGPSTLTGTEGKVSGPLHVSNILKRTLEYLVIHNEMKLAHLGMLVHFGRQNGDTDRLLICRVSI